MFTSCHGDAVLPQDEELIRRGKQAFCDETLLMTETENRTCSTCSSRRQSGRFSRLRAHGHVRSRPTTSKRWSWSRQRAETKSRSSMRNMKEVKIIFQPQPTYVRCISPFIMIQSSFIPKQMSKPNNYHNKYHDILLALSSIPHLLLQ